MSASSAPRSSSTVIVTARSRVVRRCGPLLEGAAADQPVAGDPDRPSDEVVERVDLRVGVPVGGRVRQLDRAAVVAAHRPLEQHRPLAADAQHRARQQPRVGPVQAEPARIGVDVAELVGQQVDVAVLEDLDRPEVGRPRDRAGRAARMNRDGRALLRRRHRRPVDVGEPVGLVGHDQRVDELVDLAVQDARAGCGRSSPIRWSVTRSCPGSCRSGSSRSGRPSRPSMRRVAESLARCSCCLRSSSRERSTDIALALFLCWLFSSWISTTSPVGRWVMRTAESVVFTDWPPGPDERLTSMRRSRSSSICDLDLVGLGHDDRRSRSRCGSGRDDSVDGTRWTRWTPPSNLSRL